MCYATITPSPRSAREGTALGTPLGTDGCSRRSSPARPRAPRRRRGRTSSPPSRYDLDGHVCELYVLGACVGLAVDRDGKSSPNARALFMTRQAISPLFATRRRLRLVRAIFTRLRSVPQRFCSLAQRPQRFLVAGLKRALRGVWCFPELQKLEWRFLWAGAV